MKKIRVNVFETNSSSSHSIYITEEINENLLDTRFYPNEDGNVVFKNGGGSAEFGWEFETYRDAYTKALYCIIDNFNNKDRIELIKEVVKEYTQCNEVILDDDLFEGYIDHQSQGITDELFDSVEKLKRFIFYRNSYLETGNDNE